MRKQDNLDNLKQTGGGEAASEKAFTFALPRQSSKGLSPGAYRTEGAVTLLPAFLDSMGHPPGHPLSSPLEHGMPDVVSAEGQHGRMLSLCPHISR